MTNPLHRPLYEFIDDLGVIIEMDCLCRSWPIAVSWGHIQACGYCGVRPRAPGSPSPGSPE